MLLNKDSLLITKECTLQTLITAYGVTGCASINFLLIIQNLIDAMGIYLFDVFKKMIQVLKFESHNSLDTEVRFFIVHSNCFEQLLAMTVGAGLGGERNCTI